MVRGIIAKLRGINRKTCGKNSKFRGINSEICGIPAIRSQRGHIWEVETVVRGIIEKLRGIKLNLRGINRKNRGKNSKSRGINTEIRGILAIRSQRGHIWEAETVVRGIIAKLRGKKLNFR